MTNPPSDGVDTLAVAEAESALAKARLGATLDAIKQRLTPANLLDEAINGAKTRSAGLAESAGDVLRDRPGTVAAGAVGVALLVARRPIARLARRLFSRK